MPEPLQSLHGAFTHRQARAAGWSKGAIYRHIRSGRWLRLQRGVYAAAPLREPVGLTRAAAVCLATRGVASHLTAARAHGLWVVDDGDSATVAGARRQPADHSLRVSRRRLTAREVIVLDGVRVTTVLRTLRDLAYDASRLQAVCAIEAALRAGLVDPATLGRAVRAGNRRLGTAVTLAEPLAESPLETAVRLLLRAAGLPVELQHPVGVDDFGVARFRLDLLISGTRVAVECDGREAHGQPEAVYRDRWRGNEIGALFTLLRFTWFDVRQRPEYVVHAVRRAIALQAADAAPSRAAATAPVASRPDHPPPGGRFAPEPVRVGTP